MAGPSASPAAIRALSVQNNAPASLRILSQLGLIAAMVVLIPMLVGAYGVLAALPLMAIQGFCIAFLFTPLHETAHKTAFRTRALNTVVGQLCGVLIGLPYEYYRLFHWDHHRHVATSHADPDFHDGEHTGFVQWYVHFLMNYIGNTKPNNLETALLNGLGGVVGLTIGSSFGQFL